MEMKGSGEHAGGGIGGGGDEIWLDGNTEEGLLGVNDSSIFYNDCFPPLPDFPCMSSSSSSSTAPAAPPKPVAASSSSSSTSSSAASWALLKSDAEESYVDNKNSNHHDHQPVSAIAPPLQQPTPALAPEDSVDCMDVMETFGYMELIDSNEIWDPSSIFQTEIQIPPSTQHEEQPLLHHQNQQAPQLYHQNSNGESENYLLVQNDVGVQEQQKGPAAAGDELGTMFFEWLKSNKEYISAEDMRNIKLRRATVESASKRLGGTKEGRKQLLKLILEWVQNYQLQKKQAASSSQQFPFREFQNPNPNPNPNCIINPVIPTPDTINPCFQPTTWIPPQPQYVPDPMGFPYGGGDLYNSGGGGGPSNYQTLETLQTWPPSSGQYPMGAAQIQFNQFPETNPSNSNVVTGIPNQQGFVGYGGNPNPNPYPYQQYSSYQGNNNINNNNGVGEKVVRLGSLATKEARKKRMARQKRFLSHPRHHQQHQQQNHHQQQHQMITTHNVDHNSQHLSIGGGESAGQGFNPAGNWVYWPSANNASGSSSVPVGVAAEFAPPPQVVADRAPVLGQNCQQQRQVPASEKRQGWKPEKNLKFLLQKVLKQSDVGNLGRIVLPKKEAETHLPELEARDGIAIAMEDIGTSQVWNMRYRFWPNNKSRMYLLENTGDFVRANGLQEGDFIVIYSDVMCGKYMIRGVKVRQPGTKSEAKKPAKSHRSSRTAAQANGGGSSSQPSHRE